MFLFSSAGKSTVFTQYHILRIIRIGYMQPFKQFGATKRGDVLFDSFAVFQNMVL